MYPTLVIMLVSFTKTYTPPNLSLHVTTDTPIQLPQHTVQINSRNFLPDAAASQFSMEPTIHGQIEVFGLEQRTLDDSGAKVKFGHSA